MTAAFLFVLGALAAAGAQTEASDALQAEVRRLLAELDSPELARRQSAEADLVKLGPQALALLPCDARSAEAAQRLARVRQKLQQTQAGSAMQASLVALRGRMALARVLASLEKQTGNGFDTSRLSADENLLGREFDVDFHEAPFWAALDDVLDKADLVVYPFGEKGRIELRKSPWSRGSRGRHVCHAGPLRFEAISVQSQRDFRSGIGVLKAEIEVAWEPRLVPISLKQRMADVQGIDDRQQHVAASAPNATLEIPAPRGPIASRFILDLDLPPRDARTLNELRGSLWVLALGPAGTFRFADLEQTKNVARRIAGVTVAFESATQLGKTVEVRIAVRFDEAHDALASHRAWIFNNPAQLVARDGKTLAPHAVQPTRQSGQEVGVALLFSADRPLKEFTFVYQTPTAILAAPVAYQFRDIPLP